MEELYANTTTDIIEKIKSKGISIFKNYIDKEKLKAIETEFDNMLVNYKSSLDPNTEPNRCLRTNINTEIVNQNNNTIEEMLNKNTAIGVRLGGMGVALGSQVGKSLANYF